jgi:isoleucyl-tRNA synthetase
LNLSLIWGIVLVMADFDFPKTEEKILKFWKDRKIFERSLENRKQAKRFVFFEGPPTANGRPGIHHFFGRVIKDLFVRYKTMRGFLVERKAGWDTHGLPVEIEVEKELGFKNKKDIEHYGIEKFNRKAKESVWRYKDEWERFTGRIGFWLDMQHPYITYDPKYMETLWWIVKEIDDKKLLYKGYKVLPWCPRCGTALSSHEVAQGYEDITETSVYVKFKIKPGQKINGNIVDDHTYILAWTTTPWTLPGNVALAVGKKIKYIVAEHASKSLIIAHDLVSKLGETAKVIKEIDGKDLIGLNYEPLFDIPHLQTKTAYKVYPADFVTTNEGTGVVHTAVMYGEDDYELGKKLDLPTHHTVNPDGRFTKDVIGFKDQYVKDAEKGIIEYLKNKGLLFKTEDHTHSYPFCWRCKNQLLYYAKDSWFVAMSRQRKQLLKNNSKINWLPAHLKTGRFGEFLKEAKDWAFSRERYWGTPLPVWLCKKCNSQKVIGSLEDLEKFRYHPRNTFLLMRHGVSTKDNPTDEDDSLVASDIKNDKYELTPKSRQEVEEKAESIKKNGGVNMIFSSPFLRARQTAEIFSRKLSLNIHIDERLGEILHGLVCEGKAHRDCPMKDSKRGMDDLQHEDGESWRQAEIRIFSLLRELDEKYEGKKILLVGHGDPLWLAESALLDLSDEETVKSYNDLYIKRGDFKQVHFLNHPYNEHGELDMHRPYVDRLILKCAKCGGEMHRVKDVIDVWFDSGAMPYAQWHYPFENKKVFADNFPADFIAEGIDQTRGWFYTLLAVSTLLGKGVPYKNVVSYSHVLDEKGKKMSKSVGNVVDPWEVIEKFGVDAARWYFYTVNDPADPKLFALADVGKKLNGFMMTIFNLLRFFELYAKPGAGKKNSAAKPVGVLDKWILSRFNTLLAGVNHHMDRYNLTAGARAIENFVVEDLSNWWLRRSRQRFQKPRNEAERKQASEFFRYLLFELSKLLASFTPFMAEHIYKRIDNRKESVHLEDWPRARNKFIDLELEQNMQDLRDVVVHGLAQRKALVIKVRQPLAGISLKKDGGFGEELEKILLAELNVKAAVYDPSQNEPVKLDVQLTQELIMEGYAREIIRQIQDMRKEAKYKLDEKIYASWESDSPDIIAVISKFSKEIVSDTLLAELSHGRKQDGLLDIEKEFELAPQVKIWLGVKNK